MAHLLPYCNAMFMDNGCKSLLLDVPLALRPPETARVFSPNTKEQFLDYLRSILKRVISTEHVEAIRESYGDNRLGKYPSPANTSHHFMYLYKEKAQQPSILKGGGIPDPHGP